VYLRDTLPNDVELTTKNCSVGIVGKDLPFTIYDDQLVEQYVKLIEGEERSPDAGKDDDAAGAKEPVEVMETDDPTGPQVDVQPQDQT